MAKQSYSKKKNGMATGKLAIKKTSYISITHMGREDRDWGIGIGG